MSDEERARKFVFHAFERRLGHPPASRTLDVVTQKVLDATSEIKVRRALEEDAKFITKHEITPLGTVITYVSRRKARLVDGGSLPPLSNGPGRH